MGCHNRNVPLALLTIVLVMLICTTGSHAGESQSRGKSKHKNAQEEGSDEIEDNIYSTYIQKTAPKYIDNNLNKKGVNKTIVERKTSKYEQKIPKYQPKEIPAKIERKIPKYQPMEIPAKIERKIPKYQPMEIPIKTTKIYDNKSYDFMTLFAANGHNEYSNALFDNTGVKRNGKKSIFDERKKTRHEKGVNNKINNSSQNTVLSDTKKTGENAVSLNANQIRMQLIFAVLQKLETYLESGNLTDKFLRANQVTEKGQLVARPSYETQRLNSLQNPKDFGVQSMHRIKGTNAAQKDPIRKGIKQRKKDSKKNRNEITGKTLLTNHTNLKVTEKNHVNKTIFNENKGKSKTKVSSVKLFNRQRAKEENALQNNLIGKQNRNIMGKKTYITKKTASKLSGNVNTFDHRRNQNERTHTKKTASKLSGNVNTFDHRRNQNERTHTKKTASKLSGNVNTFDHRRNQNERTHTKKTASKLSASVTTFDHRRNQNERTHTKKTASKLSGNVNTFHHRRNQNERTHTKKTASKLSGNVNTFDHRRNQNERTHTKKTASKLSGNVNTFDHRRNQNERTHTKKTASKLSGNVNTFDHRRNQNERTHTKKTASKLSASVTTFDHRRNQNERTHTKKTASKLSGNVNTFYHRRNQNERTHTKKTASKLSGNVNTFDHRRNQNERTHTKKTASKLSGNVNTFDHRRNQNERTHTKKTASKLSGNVNTFDHRRNQNERTLNAVQNIPKTQHKTIQSNNSTRRSSQKYINETLLMNERVKQGNAKDRQISTSERHGKIIDVIKIEPVTHKNVTPVEYNTISLKQDVRLHPKALQEIPINRLENKLSEVVNTMSVNVAVVDNSQQIKSRIATTLSPQVNGGEITNSSKTPSPASDTKGRQPKPVNKTNVGGTYVYEIIEIVHYGNNTKLNTSLPKIRKAFIGTNISLKTSPKNNKQGLSGTQGQTTKTFMNVEANSQNTASGNTKGENMKYKSYTKQISEKRRRTHKSINKENVQISSSLNVANKLTGNITVARTDISFLIGTKAATATSQNQPLSNNISTHTSVGWYGIATKNSIGHSNVARLDTKSNTARIHNTKHIYDNTTKTKQPSVIKEISPISPTELTAFAFSKRNQNITKNINNNRNNTAEPTAVGINISPVQPLAQSTGVNIPPVQQIAQSIGVNIPPVQQIAQHTRVNIPPVQPLAQSTGVNIPPVQQIAQHTRVNIPPVQPLAQSTGVNIPPVQQIAQHTRVNIPPVQPLAQSTGVNIPLVQPLAQSTGVNIPPVQPLAHSIGITIPSIQPLAQSTGVNIPPVQPLAQSTGVNIPPVQPLAHSIGITIPSIQPLAQSTGVNIPPVQPLAQSTGVNIPPVNPLAQSIGINIPPIQPLAQSTGVNIPPVQPLAQSTGINIPPVQQLSQSTGVNIPPVNPLAQSIGINIPQIQPLAQSTGVNIPPVQPLAQSTGTNIPPVNPLAQFTGVNIPPVQPLAQPPVDVGFGLTNLSKGKFHLIRKYLLQMIHQLNEHISAKHNPNQMLFQTGKNKGGDKSYQNHVINGASIHATKGKLQDKTSKTKQHKIKTYVSSPVQNGFQIVDLNSNQYANTNSAPTSVPHKDIHQNFNSAQLGNVRSTALKSVTNENKYLELNKQNAMSTPYRNSNLAFNTVPRRDYSRIVQSTNRTPNHKPQSKITPPNVDLISHSNNIDIEFLNPGVTLHRLKIPQINAVSRVEKEFHPIVPDIKSNLIRNNNNIPVPNNVAPIKQVSGPETGFTNRQSSINNYKSTLTKNLEALLKFSDFQLAERGKMHKYLHVPVNEKRKLNTYNSAGNLMSNHINNIQDIIINEKTNTMVPTGTGNVIAPIDSSKSVPFAGPLSQVQSNSHKGSARLAANSATNRLLEKSLLGNSIMADHTRSGLNTGIFDLVKGKSTTGNLKSDHRNAKAIPELTKSILGNNLMHDHVNSDFKTNYVWDHIKGHSLTNKKYNVVDGPGVPQISTTRLHSDFDITNAILGNAVRNLNNWNLNQGLHNSKTETMPTSPPLNRKTEILSKNTLSSDLVHNNPSMDVSSLFKDIAASVLYERLKGSTATGSNTGSGIGSQNMFNPIHTNYLNPGVHTPQQNNNNIHSKKLSTTVTRKGPSQDIHPNNFQSEFVARYQRQRSIDNWMPTNPWQHPYTTI